ncbi:MAG: hypothetical protein KF873_02105 [Gemmataceae bacterium]|nr:hypothetical protein [Gemmataceae bacterium]
MSDRDKLIDLAREVRALRNKQKAFFRSGDRCLIPTCRDLEARVDKAVAEVLDAKPAKPASLFGDDDGDDAAARFAAAEKGGGI